MGKKMVLMLLAMTVVVGGVVGFKIYTGVMMGRAMAARKPPPVAVSAVPAQEDSWPQSLHTVGSFAPVQGVTLNAELDGVVTAIAFESGAAVKAGDLLLRQDTSTEEAQLTSAEAGMELARLSLERARELRTHGTNSQADLDAATAAFRRAGGEVAAIQAIMAKKTIRAPFAGRLGIRQANLGQLLRTGSAIVALETEDPIYLNFTLPQQSAAQVAAGHRVRVTVDAYPGEVFAGGINAINPGVDAATRALQIQATLRNADGRLRSGMFGSVEVLLPTAEKVIYVPLSALVYNPYGDAVYVIETGAPDASGQPELNVRQQFVQTGVTRGDLVAVVKGIRAGEQIVTAGQMKLRNGVRVVINNSVAAAASPAPQVDRP